jgi:hypothetical protein
MPIPARRASEGIRRPEGFPRWRVGLVFFMCEGLQSSAHEFPEPTYFSRYSFILRALLPFFSNRRTPQVMN